MQLNGDSFTEAGCNGFPDSQTADHFDGDDFQLMVVAEKFQTGFDQPKLYAMYVDKTLTGLAAVQTLSRLNRTQPDKDGTFVLDFVNDAHDIAKAFEPWFGETVAPPSDPHLLYDTHHALDECGVLRRRCPRSTCESAMPRSRSLTRRRSRSTSPAAGVRP